MAKLRTLLLLALVVFCVPFAFAQQTGAIHGTVTATDGSALPGVTVEAQSPLLPRPRVGTSDANGDYRLVALPPGDYTVTFTLSGMQTATRKATVVLAQETSIDIKLGVQGVSETVTVTAQASLVEKDVTTLQNGLSREQISELPVAQNYGDLQKLIPGVMYSQDITRGPSAGGSGQSNVYLFDGANVTMPLFGVLVGEPATHDIASVNIIKGGANAVDFFRAGGFQIDSVSKSGTNRFSGEAEYQVLNHQFTAAQLGTINARFQQDNNWSTLNLGGPILSDRLFFYGSFYRPISTRANQSNVYGALPEFKSTRNEEFGKLTFTPTSAFLFNGTYRHSSRTDTSGVAFGTTSAGTTGSGSSTKLEIGTLEGSWIPNSKSFGTFKLTDFRNPGFGAPDHFVTAPFSTAIGSTLAINNLNQLGLLVVPTPQGANQAAYNAFIAPFITKYGFVCPPNPGTLGCTPGQLTGGGLTGFNAVGDNNDSFFRKSGQIGYNYTVGSNVTNDLHVGYQRYNAAEDLFRTSNGLGTLSIPGGTVNCPASACGTAKPAFFEATLQQQSAGVPIIHSEFHSQNIELNDQIHMSNWTFNVGILASNDTLFGQGLAKADNVAGFVKSPGTKYEMHNVPFSQMIQPRLGATWAYDGINTLYASYAQYNPDANSDARAASWDRNLVNTINAYYDANGVLMGIDPVKSSSGKLFVPGIKPPQVRELMIGTAKQITPGWSARVYGRYRKADRFWEDTNNNARLLFNPPPGVPQTLYIPNLGSVSAGTGLLGAIGSGSTYVIAELDGAFTKYYEATMEQDWHGKNLTLHGSYTWSHYYGNFDQDHTSFNIANDAALFIGSSNIGDGAGHQLWNYKYGDLAGDRRNIVKAYGTYNLAWRATTGVFFTFQSGQPYQLESYLPYKSLTTSTSDTNRYAEPAGSRRTPPTMQTDLNYTQNFPMPRGLNLQLLVDLFNVFNNQTGYNYESRIGSLGACSPSSVSCIATGIAAVPSVNAPHPLTYYSPRRYQIAARVQF
jgi:Carboxypeptidase regulatory-like domain